MKKILALLLAAVMCLSLAACGGNGTKEDNTTASNINPDYVGEWKCSVRMVDPEKGEYYKNKYEILNFS